MTKLTHPHYHLPVIEALSSFELFETGTTAPMAIWGVDRATGERGKYVVKFKNHDRMTIASSVAEFLGAWMALEIGLTAVEPVVINISDEFIESLKGRSGYRAASQSLGLNFGSTYVAGLTQLPSFGFHLSEKMQEQAKLLYVYDVFIQNTDRGHQRPNVGSIGEGLIIYDHELAFSFLYLLPSLINNTPWKLTPADTELYEKHYFYRSLKGKGIDLSDQVEKLTCFDNIFWDKVISTLPEEFQTKEITEIKSYLQLTIDNLAAFTSSLNKTIV